jgi:hypothetical protein
VLASTVWSSIKRWYLRVFLDTNPPWTKDALTAAFTGMDEVVLEVDAVVAGTGYAVLRLFEGVRECQRVRIYGRTTGFEGYVRWLEGSMRAPRGHEVGDFVECDGVSKVLDSTE